MHPLHRRTRREALLPRLLVAVTVGSVLGLLAGGVRGLLQDERSTPPVRRIGEEIVRQEVQAPPTVGDPMAAASDEPADPMVRCMTDYLSGYSDSERADRVDEAQRHCIAELYADD